MRRIPRLRRPAGPASSPTMQSIAPLTCQSQAARTPFPTPSPATPTRPRRSPCLFPRFYSTDGQQPGTPQSLADLPPRRSKPTIVTEEQWQEVQQNPQQPGEYIVLLPEGEGGGQEGGADVGGDDGAGYYVTPPRRTRAPPPEEVEDAGYTPATVSDGLERVGGVEGWWEEPEHWRPGGDFVGFRPRRAVADPAVLEACARRALVEALALRRAGRRDDLIGVWPLHAEDAGAGADAAPMHRALARVDVRAVVGGDGGVEVDLAGDVDGLLESLRWKDEEDAQQESREAVGIDSSGSEPGGAWRETGLSPEEAAKYRESWDRSWKNIPLVDARLKFAVTKRIFQLTGQLVPDHRLPEITNVGILLRVLQKPPKPKTLSDEIVERRPELTQLPNVSFSPKRVTRGDKEKAVGRFKLIEEEFRKRDLPLQGHGFAQKNKERSWLRGGV